MTTTTSPTPEPRPEPTTVPWPPTTTSGHPSVEILCRSSYYTDTGKRQDPGSRIVRCGLPYGHDGDHDEMIDGEPGNSWPQTPAGPTGRPPRADGADIIRDLRRQLVQEHEAAEWRQKCIDEAIAAIHDAPQEIAPLLPPVAPADLPRAVRALIDRARSQLVEALVRALTAETERDAARAALRQAEQERDEARREWRGLIDRIRTDASARGLDIEPGEDLVDGLLRIIDDRGKDRDDWQRQAEAADSLRAEVERHAGAQCGCDTNGECLARLYQQTRALVATAPETAPESPQTGEQTEVRADTHTEAQTGYQGPLDLDAIRARWLHPCGPCDAGYPTGCTCPPGDPRTVIAALAAEIDRLRDLLDEAAREIDERDKLLDIADKTELEAP